jgi:integrase
VFPSTGRSCNVSERESRDPRSGIIRCHHLHESGVQKTLKQAIRAAGIAKRIGCHMFCHSFATHLLEDSYGIRMVQEWLGHKDVKTMMIYTKGTLKHRTTWCQLPLDVQATHLENCPDPAHTESEAMVDFTLL